MTRAMSQRPLNPPPPRPRPYPRIFMGRPPSCSPREEERGANAAPHWLSPAASAPGADARFPGELVCDVGELLVRQFGGVVDARGQSVTLDLTQRIAFRVG